MSEDKDRPVVWKMIDEAVDFYKGEATYPDIRKYLLDKWNFDHNGTIGSDMQSITVNDKSRIHYGINHKPRLTNSDSKYDLLFKTGRGKVERYDPLRHGIWEIYKDENERLGVRQFSEPTPNKIFTPSDIVWFKNVTNTTIGEAYLETKENPFVIHFPTIHKTNVLSPAVDDLILVYQKVHGIPSFTHIVTPVDTELIDDNTRPEYRYGRLVKIIAKVDRDNLITVSSTLWNKVNFSGITQGNACKLENISSIGNIDELQFDVWQRFSDFFNPSEHQSSITTSAIIQEIQITNPDLSVTEGGLRLVTHVVAERDRKIVFEKKQEAIRNNTLRCEVCTFSFPENYQSDFIECHHVTPIAQGGVRQTKLEDLALVCANCHRMLHVKFDGQYLSLQQLQSRINSLKAE